VAQSWDAHLTGTIQAGTVLYLATARSNNQKTPAIGDTFRITNRDNTLTRGDVVSRFVRIVDVEVEGHGLVTIQPAPTNLLARLSRSLTGVRTSKWVIV
jgi:hypothetical protein